MPAALFSQHFVSIQDPRQSAKISHLLFDVLFLTVCAVIAGYQGWEEIEDFGDERLDWLQKYGLFNNGIPTHDTIARIISRIDSSQLQRCFINWMQATVQLTEGDIIAVDGKTLRSSYHRDDRRSAIHMVSAFASANSVVLGQLKTEQKSNEIKAIPELLSLLELKGCLVTIDAMGCQKEIAQSILDRNADYVLSVKGNQKNLFDAVRQGLKSAISAGNESQVIIERHHGRVECREYHVLPTDTLTETFSGWPSLTTMGVAISYRLEKGQKESMDYRYYISSAALSAQRFAEAVRQHWAIENQLHWVLDVSMNEDASQIYRGNAAENLACVRHMGLNMLRAEKSRKMSIPRRQRIAALNPDYLERILVAGLDVSN